MFCHQYWDEKIEFKTFTNLPYNQIDDGPVVASHEDSWCMPCSFDDKEIDLFAYYTLYCVTFNPLYLVTSPDKSLKADDQLL